MKWEILGVQLKLDMSILEEIKAQLAYKPIESRSDTAFIAIFTNWKRRRPSAFAWATIITVLRTDSLGEQALAQNLHKKLIDGEI